MILTHAGRLTGVLLPAAVLFACAPTAHTPGVRRARDFAAQLDSVVPALMRENGVPGFAVGVVEHGRVAFTQGYGLADVAAGRPMRAGTLMNFASVSKPVTAWGVLRLVDAGTLPLDAPIGPLLHRWQLPASPLGTEGVTVRRLLSHTAGLSVPATPWFPADTTLPSLEAVLRGEAGERGPVTVQYAPGARWAYSGGGYAVLQLMVEEASGRPFAEYMRGTVFEPLGMRRTTFAPAAVVGEGMATPYDEQGNPIAPYRLVGAAAGGLFSSADDFARFLTAYARPGSGVLRPATFETMLTDVAAVQLDGADMDATSARYGLGHGVHRTRGGERLVYHSGGNPGARAYFLVIPERGDGLVLISNSDNSVPVIARLLELWSERQGVDLPPLF
jgi:CubicO group peptidase (beta-lactamase class C family)